MTSLSVSQHAEKRLSQRGIALSDVDLVMQIGSEVEGGFLVRTRDRQKMECELKRLIQRLRHLEGKRVVISNGCIVTAYHANKSEERRLLRR